MTDKQWKIFWWCFWLGYLVIGIAGVVIYANALYLPEATRQKLEQEAQKLEQMIDNQRWRASDCADAYLRIGEWGKVWELYSHEGRREIAGAYEHAMTMEIMMYSMIVLFGPLPIYGILALVWLVAYLLPRWK